jgi:serine/threonine protein kinase
MSMIGKSLAHYSIISQIGKGGMGEVYQAKDQKLGREVAIKVLPEEFARDHDRVARFQREAKLLASLNHPNIASIHGLEESGGTHFLVMELIEGDTLEDQIKKGPIPVEEALKLGLQIAEALEAAHEKGVIHRDLKPANIKITPDGKAKVLDFGLAKAFAGDPESMNLSNSPTLSEAATMQGVILGTAAYMPPEQAKGKTVDKRADIWAFGVVLFEMLTGRQLFTGETISETLASVLKTEPVWQSLPQNIHPRIRFLLERCLKKDPKNRYSSISDARVDIQEVLDDAGGVFARQFSPAEPRRNLRSMLPWVAVAVVLTAIIVGVFIWNLRAPEPRRVIRLDYVLPENQQFSVDLVSSLAVSPDGTQVVYSTPGGIYIRSENELDARLIAGTDKTPVSPFFSPDGHWIGYFSIADDKLKKIPINGGASVTLCNVTGVPVGASWSADDMIVFGQYPGSIMRIPANGGTPEPLVEAEGVLYNPQILPDGKTVMFSHQNSTITQVEVQSIETGERKELFPGHSARYLPTGHIVYAVENNLLAVPFDLGKLEVLGGGVPVVEGVLINTISDWLHYAISDSGTLVYRPGPASGGMVERTLVWVDREGREESLGAPPGYYSFPNLSPDGKQVALTVRGVNIDIKIWDTLRKTLTRLTFEEASDIQSLWTPDGDKIVFASDREGSLYNLYWKNADGTGTVEKLASMPDRALLPWSWSSDGKTLIMLETNLSAIWDIGMLSMEGERVRKPLLNEEKPSELNPRISPDGGYMAYASSESGQVEVYVRPFPEVEKGKWQVSTAGGNSPLWSPDGRELFYLTDGNSVMAVGVEIKPTFSLGTPKELFHGSFVNGTGEGTPWDLHPDGDRFLMIKPPGAPLSTVASPRFKIIIVTNWFEELKQQAPVE